MTTWLFSCRDNGGKFQVFRVKAPSKPEAIDKAFKRARKHAAGDITTWDCKLAQIG